jgi:hypothetical protein
MTAAMTEPRHRVWKPQEWWVSQAQPEQDVEHMPDVLHEQNCHRQHTTHECTPMHVLQP